MKKEAFRGVDKVPVDPQVHEAPCIRLLKSCDWLWVSSQWIPYFEIRQRFGFASRDVEVTSLVMGI